MHCGCGNKHLHAMVCAASPHLSSPDLVIQVGTLDAAGHAPMMDMPTDKALGRILLHFHRKQKPTALICHAPVALLATREVRAALSCGFMVRLNSAALPVFSSRHCTMWCCRQRQRTCGHTKGTNSHATPTLRKRPMSCCGVAALARR